MLKVINDEFYKNQEKEIRKKQTSSHIKKAIY